MRDYIQFISTNNVVSDLFGGKLKIDVILILDESI